MIRTWGTPRTEEGLKNHVELVDMLGIADLEKGLPILCILLAIDVARVFF